MSRGTRPAPFLTDQLPGDHKGDDLEHAELSDPFTTSTAFVFTITGADVPQNLKIQILTITGKIVREITKDELGPLHVGRNITEFKWNGTDAYGQRLANGVYLYHVVTNLTGRRWTIQVFLG